MSGDGSTLSRDIRLTEMQLIYGRDAIRDRRRLLERRLAKTSYDGKPGMKDRVVTELRELRELERVLSHNLDQIARELTAAVYGKVLAG